MDWHERDGVRWLETDLGDGARAAFSTRIGGVSGPPFDSLNLGILTEDSREAVAENRRRLAAALGHQPDRIAYSLQVHKTQLIDHPPEFRGAFGMPATKREPTAGLAEADGHVVREPGPVPLVFVADCIPVALRGPGGIALVHAGWRGLAGGIVGKAAAAIGATDAAVGPGIGSCCYEVGDEVLKEFAGLGEGIAQGGMLDLPEVARRLLRQAGAERVESAGLCTSCDGDLFFSHRRDQGRTGRQAGLAWLEGGD